MTPSAGRIIGVDVARGVALFAMMATHVFPLVVDNEPTGALVFAGRASALFAVLAGVSIALASRPWSIRDGRGWAEAASGVVVRGLLIVAVGLTMGMFPSGLAVILVQYGMMFLLAAAVLRLPAWALGSLAGVWMLVSPAVSMWWRLEPLPMIAGENPTWGDLLTPSAFVADVFLDGYYPVLTWFGYILLGMAVGRLDLQKTRTAAYLVLSGVLVAATALMTSSILLASGGYAALTRDEPAEFAGLLQYGTVAYTLRISGYGTTPTDSWWWLASAGPHTGAPPDLVSTAAIALAVIGFSLLITALGRWAAPALAFLWVPGSMPLSVYCLHIVAFTALGSEPPWVMYLVHVGLAIGCAAVWRALVSRRGPLESVLAMASGAARGAWRDESAQGTQNR